QCRFGGGAGFGAAGGGSQVGVGKGLAVDLAVLGEGEGVHHHQGRRDHVVRQSVGQGGSYGVGVDGVAGGGDGVADPGGVTGGVLSCHDHALADLGVLVQGVFDLTEFDPKTTDLDLVIGAAEVVQGTVGAAAYQVPGAVHATSGWAEGVGDKAVGGQFGAADVAAGQSFPGDVQVTGASGRY